MTTPKLNKCDCIGFIADLETQELSDRKFGSYEELKFSFYEKYKKKLADHPKDEQKIENYLNKKDKLWEEFVKQKIEFEKKYFNDHPLKNSPRSDCEICGGTGIIHE